MSDFQGALKRLLDDPAFGDAVIKNPALLKQDFADLDARDMMLLMQVWHASGHPDAERLSMLVCHCCCPSPPPPPPPPHQQ